MSAPVPARGGRQTRSRRGPDTRVSVVVLTHDRPDELITTLARMHKLTERPPISVIDNASREPLHNALERQFPEVGYVRLPENIGAAARNQGVEAARTPYVALCDDDTWWERGSLRRAANVLDAHPDVAVVCARTLVGKGSQLDPVCAAMEQSPLDCTGLPGRAVLGFLAGSAVYRRSAYLGAGGFRQQFMVGGEEELMALDLAAAGWRLAYVPEVVARHYPSPSRNPDARRRHQLRNAVLVAWLRRPVSVAAQATARLARQAIEDRPARLALLDVARNGPWLFRSRRLLPASVEADVRLLESWTPPESEDTPALAGRRDDGNSPERR